MPQGLLASFRQPGRLDVSPRIHQVSAVALPQDGDWNDRTFREQSEQDGAGGKFHAAMRQRDIQAVVVVGTVGQGGDKSSGLQSAHGVEHGE